MKIVGQVQPLRNIDLLSQHQRTSNRNKSGKHGQGNRRASRKRQEVNDSRLNAGKKPSSKKSSHTKMLLQKADDDAVLQSELETKKSRVEFKQLSRVADMNKQLLVSRSSAHLCGFNRNPNREKELQQKDREAGLMSKSTLISDLKRIQFFYPPRKEFDQFALTPLQKNILISSKANNAKFLEEASKRADLYNFQVKDQHGNTPLYYAAKGQNVEAVQTLLGIGVDVNAKCEYGNTCLHTAMLVKDGNPRNERIVNMLLNNGVTKPKATEGAETKPAVTRKRSKRDCDKQRAPFQSVAGNTANIRALNNQNETPLFYATQQRKVDFGWCHDAGRVMTYDQIGYWNIKQDPQLTALQNQIKEFEDVQERMAAMPENLVKIKSSLTLNQIEEARRKKVTIPLPPGATEAHREVIRLVNTDEEGRHDATIHKKWAKHLRSLPKPKPQPSKKPDLPWECKKTQASQALEITRKMKHNLEMQERQRLRSVMRIRASVESSMMRLSIGEGVNPAEAKALISTSHAEAMKVLGDLGHEQVKNRVKLPHDKRRKSYEVVKDIWRKHARSALRREALEDAMIRNEVTWVAPVATAPTEYTKYAQDGDGTIPEVEDSRAAFDTLGSMDLRASKNTAVGRQTYTQTRVSSRPISATQSRRTGSRSAIRAGSRAFNAPGDDSQLKSHDEIEFASAKPGPYNYNSKEVLRNYTSRPARGRPQTAVASGRPALPLSSTDLARFGQPQQHEKSPNDYLHAPAGRISCLLSSGREEPVRNSQPLVMKQSYGSLRRREDTKTDEQTESQMKSVKWVQPDAGLTQEMTIHQCEANQ